MNGPQNPILINKAPVLHPYNGPIIVALIDPVKGTLSSSPSLIIKAPEDLYYVPK